MTPSSGTPRDRALIWWQERVRARGYVVGRDEFPPTAEARVLRRERLVLEMAEGGVWILCQPTDDPRATFLTNYWRVVAAVLAAYGPAVVERLSAVRLDTDQFGVPTELFARHAANASVRTITLFDEYRVRLTPGRVGDTRKVDVAGTMVPADPPAATLVRLTVGDVRAEVAMVAVWLRYASVTPAALDAAYIAAPRPVLLRRMGLMAREVCNRRLADAIDGVLAAHEDRTTSPSKTGVGRTIIVPPALVAAPHRTGAWLDRHDATFAADAAAIRRAVGRRVAALPRFPRARLLRHARRAKAYDAYHSTTIEGYRITPEQAAVIVEGRALPGATVDEVQQRAALQGYSAAFDEATKVLAEGHGPLRIDEGIVFDLYEALFSPSIDAGLVGRPALRQWRRQPAFIRGSAHVPPSDAKLPALMARFVDAVNGLLAPEDAVVRAVMTHLDFVTIHPFLDGNGRVARFLMNLALVSAGLPWATIRVEDRDRYFRALEVAEVRSDPLPFAGFVLEYVERGVAGMTANRRAPASRPRS